MPDIYVDPTALSNPSPQVIRVGGICYEKVENSSNSPDTMTVDEEFDDCEVCQGLDSSTSISSLSSQSSSSSSSSTINQSTSSNSSSSTINQSTSSLGFSSSSSSINMSTSTQDMSTSSQSGVANACAGETCSGTNNPSIQLTVSNLGATETINWCGETWNLPADNGETRCVCPTTYNLDKEISTSVTTMAKNREFWSVAGGAGLVLNRAFSVTSFVSAGYFRYGRLWGIENRPAPTASDLLRRARNLGVYTWTTQVQTIGVVTANEFSLPSLDPATTGKEPTISNYKVLDEQFGSYTDANSVTWEWERGINWP